MAERKSVLLRIPEPLWRQLKRLAEQDLRSVNGEIEFLLRDALKRRGHRLPPESDEEPPE
ncbi:MAG: Arc family DNA-binding protein [Fimbriimonadaceae bacterium]|nr:Arc family DNA-binding protein [Chthonomonadaceae bacterium]MCO5295392.1 Arc family DNA-binding protein [Fimbriimonadaceae bacterium]